MPGQSRANVAYVFSCLLLSPGPNYGVSLLGLVLKEHVCSSLQPLPFRPSRSPVMDLDGRKRAF